MTYTTLEKDIISQIRCYYLDKARKHLAESTNPAKLWDTSYLLALREVQELQITRVLYTQADSKLTITLHRPGLLIGEKGNNLQALTDYLRANTSEKNLTIKIEEDHLFNYLFPVDYTEGC